MKRVIIVDDQATNRRVMSMLISRVDANAQVNVFEDPIKALVFAYQHTPDLLITDFRMPFINGVELIRRFRDFPHCGSVPAVMVTAHQDSDARRLAFEAGTTDFLALPFDHAKFCERSRRLLALSDGPGVVELPSAAAVVEHPLQQTLLPAPESIGQIEMFNRLLETVGAKLLHKADELDKTCAEMDSLIALCEHPVVVVDQESQIRWFSDAMCHVFRLNRSSIGGSIRTVIGKLDYPELEHDLALAEHTRDTVLRPLPNYRGSQSYGVKIIPNVSHTGVVRGATLVFEKVPALDVGAGNRTWH